MDLFKGLCFYKMQSQFSGICGQGSFKKAYTENPEEFEKASKLAYANNPKSSPKKAYKKTSINAKNKHKKDKHKA